MEGKFKRQNFHCNNVNRLEFWSQSDYFDEIIDKTIELVPKLLVFLLVTTMMTQ